MKYTDSCGVVRAGVLYLSHRFETQFLHLQVARRNVPEPQDSSLQGTAAWQIIPNLYPGPNRTLSDGIRKAQLLLTQNSKVHRGEVDSARSKHTQN